MRRRSSRTSARSTTSEQAWGAAQRRCRSQLCSRLRLAPFCGQSPAARIPIGLRPGQQSAHTSTPPQVPGVRQEAGHSQGAVCAHAECAQALAGGCAGLAGGSRRPCLGHFRHGWNPTRHEGLRPHPSGLQARTAAAGSRRSGRPRPRRGARRHAGRHACCQARHARRHDASGARAATHWSAAASAAAARRGHAAGCLPASPRLPVSVCWTCLGQFLWPCFHVCSAAGCLSVGCRAARPLCWRRATCCLVPSLARMDCSERQLPATASLQQALRHAPARHDAPCAVRHAPSWLRPSGHAPSLWYAPWHAAPGHAAARHAAAWLQVRVGSQVKFEPPCICHAQLV